jgi:Trk K+ transport system NAD-binding subunit
MSSALGGIVQVLAKLKKINQMQVFFFLNIRRLLIVKLIMPEKHIAVRLQKTTSQPEKRSISRSTPNRNRNTIEFERLYTA